MQYRDRNRWQNGLHLSKCWQGIIFFLDTKVHIWDYIWIIIIRWKQGLSILHNMYWCPWVKAIILLRYYTDETFHLVFLKSIEENRIKVLFWYIQHVGLTTESAHGLYMNQWTVNMYLGRHTHTEFIHVSQVGSKVYAVPVTTNWSYRRWYIWYLHLSILCKVCVTDTFRLFGDNMDIFHTKIMSIMDYFSNDSDMILYLSLSLLYNARSDWVIVSHMNVLCG